LAVNVETGCWFCHSTCAVGGSVIKFEMSRSNCDFPQALANFTAITGYINSRADYIVSAVYDYTDVAGTLLYQIERRIPKSFKARRPDGKGGWIYNLSGVRRVLYNLPAVVKARTVYVVEGEQDANSLIARGLTATTCVFGAEKWRDEYNQHLIGRDVFLVPDRDERGAAHRDMVGRSLVGQAASIKVIDLPTARNCP
jgi:DNA primase